MKNVSLRKLANKVAEQMWAGEMQTLFNKGCNLNQKPDAKKD